MAGNKTPLDIEAQIAQLRSYDTLAETHAAKYGLDPALIKAMISQESAGNPRAQSSKGAQGLMQLMPATAQELGVTDVFDPEQNIAAGTKYFSQLHKRYKGDNAKALAAYNAGMGNFDSGKAATFPETQDYVKRILANYQPSQPAQAKTASLNFAPSQASTAAPTQPEDVEAQIHALRQADQPKVEAKPEAEGFLSRIVHHPVDSAVDALPVIGGAVGGVVGGVGGTVAGFGVGGVPGAIGGAALGGSAGEAARQLIERYRGKQTPQTSGDAARGIAKEGVIQGATEAVGGAVGGVVKGVGRGLIKKAFRPSADVLLKHPEIVEDLIKSGVNPTVKGIATSEAATTSARATADAAVSKAGATRVMPNGVKMTPKVPTQEVLDALLNNPKPGQKSVWDEVLELGEQKPSVDRMGRYFDNVLKDNGPKLTYDRTLSLRRAEGKASHKVFDGTLENPGLDKELHAATELGAQKALERRVPGLDVMNAKTAKELRVLKVVQDAVAARAQAGPASSLVRHGIAAVPAAVVGTATGVVPGLAAWAAAEAAANPTVQAVTGRAATKVAGPLATGIKAAARLTEAAPKKPARKPQKKADVTAAYQRYLQDQ